MKFWWLIAGAMLMFILLFSGCKKESTEGADEMEGQITVTEQPNETMNEPTAVAKDIPGLVIEDVKVGTGTEATAGKNVTVHYTGRLTNGNKFDSSLDRNEPFTFTLGAGQVIEGWDKGVAGMKVGGKRKLTISPELGYGPGGMGPIPPNSTLVFDVELLKVN